MIEYDEIMKLKKMLDSAGIPYEYTLREGMEDLSLHQLCYPCADVNKRIYSVIEVFVSYDGDDDMLEIIGLLIPDELEQDGEVGYLSADEVFSYIIAAHEKEKDGES